MDMQYSVTFETDEVKRRIKIRVFGPIESALYVDECIAFYKSLEAPWTYQRMVDLRESTGHVKYEDIIRLSQFWSSTPQGAHPVRTASVVRAKEELSRNPSVNLLFGTHTVGAFTDEAEAIAWLDADLPA